MRNEDKERITQKREAALRAIVNIAPHAEILIGILDEIKLDLLLLALGSGDVVVREG